MENQGGVDLIGAIEKLGLTVTPGAVSIETGLDVDRVEDELRELMVRCRGEWVGVLHPTFVTSKTRQMLAPHRRPLFVPTLSLTPTYASSGTPTHEVCFPTRNLRRVRFEWRG